MARSVLDRIAGALGRGSDSSDYEPERDAFGNAVDTSVRELERQVRSGGRPIRFHPPQVAGEDPGVLGRVSEGGGAVEEPSAELLARLEGGIEGPQNRSSWGRKQLMSDNAKLPGLKLQPGDIAGLPETPVGPIQYTAPTRTLKGAAGESGQRKRKRARKNLGAKAEVAPQGPSAPSDVIRAERQRIGQEDRQQAEADLYQKVMSGQGTPAEVAMLDSMRRGGKVARGRYPGEQAFLSEMGGQWVENPLTGEKQWQAGHLQREAAAQQEVQLEEQVLASQIAEAKNRELVEAEGRHQAMIESEQMRIAEGAEVIAAMKDQQAGIQRATDMLEQTAEVDPGRWWSDRTAGQKFLAVLAAVGGGLFNKDPIAPIQAMIHRDIEAQKATFQQRRGVLQGRTQQQAASSNLYSVIAEHAETSKEADLMVESVRMQEAQMRIDAMVASGRARMLPEQHKMISAQFAQAQAGIRKQLADMRASSTKYRFVRQRMVPRGVTSALMGEAKETRSVSS